MRINKILSLLSVGLLVSCQFFNDSPDGIPVARVNDVYLYEDDISDIVPEGSGEVDSLLRVQNFIDQWATQQLLINQAKINLSEDKQNEFQELVRQYEIDLYTKAYMEGLVKQRIDTIVTPAEAETVYMENSESFKLNEELIKFRYVHLDENNLDLDEIEERFKRFDDEDKKVLDSISLQFRSFSLNDSIWIRINQVVEKIDAVNPENRNELLKKTNFIRLEDSLGLYLMQINDVLLRNETAPLEYVMPTLKQIVINKRKIEFIKQLEKDITKDAINNRQFEIYKKE
ncbi:MAG: peptidyl-prolyl cis-trans isomerase [Bacteroidia bacterium]|nr:peptidyl-prolyl cis-trans isomerase [Bacteroidia bacterium]MBT8268167.1 peptidyl-prolyl cis-trans isomerase [Bacteroidia bacterium]NNK68935.1 peptidyl-prolyl cis-trans isomerase [Flavobacteriaceae bacterium]NNL80423.1 peptidyl-prolyl cis-trans isomerase [Flavobacteriaceae bacterium]